MNTMILQFGEGRFLRGFVDWMIQRMNDTLGCGFTVRILQPNAGTLKPVSLALNSRGGQYEIATRGLLAGRTIDERATVSCVTGVDVPANLGKYAVDPELRFVVSNTTEAGIQYVPGADTYPAKLLRLLRARHAAGLPGVVVLPCELIEHNGDRLRECVLRHLADESPATDVLPLRRYIEEECVFCSTLVDRIVTGGEGADVCVEPFHFLAVQCPAGYDLEAELPLAKAGLDVVYADDIGPYRTRKIRLLNATHTTIACLALEKGFSEVAECLGDAGFNAFVRRVVFDEILPTVDLPDEEKRAYAESVLERFANPFAHHRLQSIALNTLAKWKARCLPVVCDYRQKFGRLPDAMMEGYDAIARRYDAIAG